MTTNQIQKEVQKHMEMQCDPQWVLELLAERDELRAALAQTDALASARLAENERLHNALAEGEQLISGDLVGIEWKKACAAFLKRAREALYQQDKP